MVELLVNKVKAALDRLRSVTGIDVTINPRTGMALFPEHGRTPEELLLGAGQPRRRRSRPAAGSYTPASGA